MSKKKKFKKYHKADLLHQALASPHETHTQNAVVAHIPSSSHATSQTSNHSENRGSEQHAATGSSTGGSLVPPTAVVLKDVRRIGFITAAVALLYVAAYIAEKNTALFEKTADFLFRVLNIS